MPPLGNTFITLDCSNNLITDLSNLPENITTLNIDSNPVACLPELHQIGSFSWYNTNIHCLPNYGNITSSTPSISTLSLCLPTDTCPALWSIEGKVFFDADSNCTQDTMEVSLRNIPVALDSGGSQLQEFFTDNNGRYSFKTGLGNYLIRVDTANAPFRVMCPASFSSTTILTAADSMQTGFDFGLLCNSGYDLVARNITPVMFFRPGFQSTLYLNAGDGLSFSGESCTAGLSGSVVATLDPLLSYFSPANGALIPTSVVGNIITWNIADYSLINPQTDFNLIVEVSTGATINDTVCVTLNVNPTAGDNIPANNSIMECFPVRGSFDPNEKYMSPSGLVDTSQQWFTFTVFFQNTGTAFAENIFILDTLDQNLDPATFTFISSSHDVVTQVLPGSILRFNYFGINLPDSNANEPASHGYVKYKVKRNDNLPINTTISNTAHIFFDFNQPIVTNTVSATLALNVVLSEIPNERIIIYPSPAVNQLTVDGRQYTIDEVAVYNLLSGKVPVGTNAVSKSKLLIDVSGLPAGVYFLQIHSSLEIIVKRFVKQE